MILQPVISTAGTIIPRHLAASIDNLIAMILGICAAKSLPHTHPAVQTALCVAVYLTYFFAFEALISRTPGKFYTGLVVVRYDGERISVRQAAIRTALRFIEVNPALLGALPAALSIVFTQHNQRIGDKAAGTVVVCA